MWKTELKDETERSKQQNGQIIYRIDLNYGIEFEYVCIRVDLCTLYIFYALHFLQYQCQIRMQQSIDIANIHITYILIFK